MDFECMRIQNAWIIIINNILMPKLSLCNMHTCKSEYTKCSPLCLCECQKLLLLLWMSMDLFNAFNFSMCLCHSKLEYIPSTATSSPQAPYLPRSSIHNLFLSSSKFIWCENDSVYACFPQYISVFRSITRHSSITSPNDVDLYRIFGGKPEENLLDGNVVPVCERSWFFGVRNWQSTYVALLRHHHTITRISLFRLCVLNLPVMSFLTAWKSLLFTIHLFSHRKSLRFVWCVNRTHEHR